jgi:uncharacterized phage protein gp47/JayE
MPNSVGPDGLQIQTIAEIISEIENGTADYPGMFAIYGPNINVNPNSPDGQMINIVAQAKLDMEEFIQQVYDSFDPDQAVGVSLDRDCAYNGVFRNAGTYTLTNVTVTASQAVTLPGLDTAPSAPFTVSDASGSLYWLVNSYSFGGAGSTALAFQAAVLGPVTPIVNTITTVVTITLGVVSVNNPTAATSIGTAEESDAALRIRRANSVAISSKGYFASHYGTLIDTVGVTSVNLIENNTAGTVGGIPSHSIWTIVTGGTDAAVGAVIYAKRNAGCGMKGSTTVNITQVDGSAFTVAFDRPVAETLYIELNMTAITGSAPAASYVRTQLAALSVYGIGKSAFASQVTSLLETIAPNCYFDTVNVSPDGTTWTASLAPTGVNYQFGLTTAHIKVNGSY